jgi:hypothetical protein
MTFLEINNIVQTLRALAFAGIYASWARGAALAGRFDGEAGLVLLGKGILVLIAATVVAGIVLHVIGMIVTIVAGQESKPGEMDERDRLIDQKSFEHGFNCCGLGLLAAVIALWYGWGAVWGFHLILAGFTAGDVLMSALKFRAYLRGSP